MDGTLVPTPSAVIGGAMRPVISDVQDAADADAVRVDWIAQSPSTNPGTFVSDTFEADDARAVWGTLTAADAAGVTFETRSGNDAAPPCPATSRSAPAARSRARLRS